ncbi:MAG: hypothetical protein QNJ56_08170 [Gammaproteobacteria bacterium]|nr:hypothetical protein [Gammaproteobacteria bacterium]
MPFIHIHSLPLEPDRDIPALLSGLNQAFSTETEIPLEHIHSTWNFIAPGYYAKGKNTPSKHPAYHHPLLVELLTPDFNNPQTITIMLECIAHTLAQLASWPVDNIFINHRQAHAGSVFDDGQIVQW